MMKKHKKTLNKTDWLEAQLGTRLVRKRGKNEGKQHGANKIIIFDTATGQEREVSRKK